MFLNFVISVSGVSTNKTKVEAMAFSEDYSWYSKFPWIGNILLAVVQKFSAIMSLIMDCLK